MWVYSATVGVGMRGREQKNKNQENKNYLRAIKCRHIFITGLSQLFTTSLKDAYLHPLQGLDMQEQDLEVKL